MSEFKAPLEDIVFSLDQIANAGRLASWNKDEAEEILDYFAKIAEGVLAPINASGDAEGAKLEDGRVIMPNGFKAAYQELCEAGWQSASVPENFGGMALSPLILAGISEIFSGANHAMQMVCNLVPGAVQILLQYGTEQQQQEYLPKLADGSALSTMCLTEPQAGSDLSAIRCKAQQQSDGTWQLNGEKIFISGGDQDLSDTILHLVLARSGEQSDGIKGLSLFLCPAHSAVKITRIEEKMGLHASPTCQMLFDDAQAELIGEEGAGLKAMFTLMNHARIDVALQGVAHATRAFELSKAYAEERIQGRHRNGAPTRISEHADVKRMLDRQRDLARIARAACHLTLVELELGEKPEFVEFLTPICKIMGSEAGIEAADLGIQILGGYGYLTEYGVEQIWRDARITAIYEGANGIHRRALATRGLTPKGGAEQFEGYISDLIGHNEQLKNELSLWTSLKEQLKSSDDPTEHAFEFSERSIALLANAIRAKFDLLEES